MRNRRMTVQFLMIVVALSAGATYFGLVAWRTISYGIRAENHRRHLNSAHSFLYDSSELREWHERMQRKYEFAASRPWLTAEPDPLPP
jgi:hypothetical protein